MVRILSGDADALREWNSLGTQNPELARESFNNLWTDVAGAAQEPSEIMVYKEGDEPHETGLIILSADSARFESGEAVWSHLPNPGPEWILELNLDLKSLLL
jgi:hypothetical protein